MISCTDVFILWMVKEELSSGITDLILTFKGGLIRIDKNIEEK